MPVTILLADHHRIVRQGLRALLEGVPGFQLVGEAANGEEALRQVERHRPTVLVLELRIAGLSGLDVIRQVRQRSPGTHVVVLSMHSDRSHVQEATQAGAEAYVLKKSSAEELIRAMRAVVSGRHYFSPTIAPYASALQTSRPEGARADPFLALTPRERQVVQLTIEGHSSTQIAGQLSISPRTVESHRANVMRKLGVRNLKELIRQALQRDIPPAGQ